MVSKNDTLFLFTAQFPYGNKSETFLETEILYLSNSFKKVILFPTSCENQSVVRSIPSNVTVNNSLVNLEPTSTTKFFHLVKNPIIVLSLLNSEFKRKGLINCLKNIKVILDYTSRQLNLASCISSNLNNGQEPIFYDYWFVNCTLALGILKRKKVIKYFVSRGHGFDIYDERNQPFGVIFRNWKIKQIDKLFIISQFGLNYFKQKIDVKYHSKLFLSHLGVSSQTSLNPSYEKRDVFTIVSCSSMLDFKQVHKIPEIINLIDRPVHWIHFGDGPTRKQVENNINELKPSISVELKGHVSNDSVIDFYKSEPVNLFLSLSLSEGLPVSMMEAQSFGIPIVSFPVGGIPELVINGETGFLLNEEMTDIEIVKVLQAQLDFSFDKKKITAFFKNNFEASQNYTNFINQLCSLEK